ncbi:hypothetical protein QE177_10950 [Arsenophonus sp. aPb]|uniref:hypothetical protein n=1 Tax=Arsenophonus sp. aPb TaxID=3041619 RepID=UPI002468881C|nr:hypothetical protein [Arsenophonus sp. aPb]WGL97716.1 hypothetical protein QE177_10950 [Arsenophonus sp. aPb]
MKLIFKALTIISLLVLSFLSLADNNDETIPRDMSYEGLIEAHLPEAHFPETNLIKAYLPEAY